MTVRGVGGLRDYTMSMRTWYECCQVTHVDPAVSEPLAQCPLPAPSPLAPSTCYQLRVSDDRN